MSRSGSTAFEFTGPYQMKSRSNKTLSGMFKVNPIRNSPCSMSDFICLFADYKAEQKGNSWQEGDMEIGQNLIFREYTIVHVEMSRNTLF